MLHTSKGDESKRYLTSSFHLPLFPMLVCDGTMTIESCNEAMEQLLAFQSEELRGKEFSEIGFALDPSEEACLSHYLLNRSIVEYVVKFNFLTKQKRIICALTNIRSIFNESGELVQVAVALTKIFHSKGFSQKLNTPDVSPSEIHREELFHAFVSSIGQTLGVNCVMICQLSKEKQYSKVKMFWENGRIFSNIVFTNTGTPCQQTIRKKGPHFMTKTGYHFPEQRFLQERKYDWYAGLPIHNFRGDCIGHISILNNQPLPGTKIIRSVLFSMVTQVGVELERALHEQAINEIEEKYKLVFDHTTDAILIFDHKQERILDFNQRALNLLGCSIEELEEHHSILDFSPENQADGTESKEAFELRVASVFQQRQTQRIDWRFHNARGIKFDTKVNLTPYHRTESGTAWMLVIQQIAVSSELDELELLKINKLKITAREEKLQTEIDYQNRKLSSNLMLSSQLTQLLYSIRASLQELESDVSDEGKNRINRMLKEIDRSIDLDEDWRKFKLHFEKVHPDFFTKLHQRFPRLNSRQLRHCAYIQLGLSSKETAQLLNVAPKSIEMARYRLKKKLGLDKKERLSIFIRSI